MNDDIYIQSPVFKLPFRYKFHTLLLYGISVKLHEQNELHVVWCNGSVQMYR